MLSASSIIALILFLVACSAAAQQCADDDAGCAAWSSAGECVNNPGFMLERCKWSCNACDGACQDSQGKAAAGYCTQNPGYMEAQCQMSCNTCEVQAPAPVATPSPTNGVAECLDAHENCGSWALAGQCSSNPRFMNSQCRVSCSTCDNVRAPPPPTPPPTEATPAPTPAPSSHDSRTDDNKNTDDTSTGDDKEEGDTNTNDVPWHCFARAPHQCLAIAHSPCSSTAASAMLFHLLRPLAAVSVPCPAPPSQCPLRQLKLLRWTSPQAQMTTRAQLTARCLRN